MCMYAQVLQLMGALYMGNKVVAKHSNPNPNPLTPNPEGL